MRSFRFKVRRLRDLLIADFQNLETLLNDRFDKVDGSIFQESILLLFKIILSSTSIIDKLIYQIILSSTNIIDKLKIEINNSQHLI